MRLVVVVGRHWPLSSGPGRPRDGPARSADGWHLRWPRVNLSRRQSATTASAPTGHARVRLAAPPPSSATLPMPSTGACRDGRHMATTPEPSAWEGWVFRALSPSATCGGWGLRLDHAYPQSPLFPVLPHRIWLASGTGPLPGGAGGGWPLECLILSPRQSATMVGTPPDQAPRVPGHPPPGLSHAARGPPQAADLAGGSARGEPWTMPPFRSDRAGTLWRIFPRGR